MPTLVNYSGEGKLFHPKKMHFGAPFTSRRYKMEQNKQPSIEALPDECLSEIFRRLPGQERSACACVSKNWLNLLSSIRRTKICKPDLDNSEDEGFLSRCLIGKKATDLRLQAIAVGASNRGGLGKLSIRGNNSVDGVTDIGISGIAQGCPSLKALTLWNLPFVGDKGLSEIAKGCPLLEKLDLSHCPAITNEGLIAIAENCSHLSSITIESCSRIGNEGLEAISKFCAKIEMISIKNCPLIGDQGIASLSSSSSLTTLKLNGLSISDFTLSAIGHYLKSITNLSLSYLNNVSEKGFSILGNAGGLESLMSLSITSCLGVTDLSIESIGKGCCALKKICLQKCVFLSDQGLSAFSKSAVFLESLHLEEINKITLSGVITALSVSGSNLRILSLVSCVGIKDLFLGDEVLLTTPCRSLKSLSVKNCTGFGNAGLIILGKMCPALCQLDITGIYGVTDGGLLSFLSLCEGAFVKLNFNGCFNLSDEVITEIAKTHGQTIKTMDLEGCMRLTDLSLFAIAKNYQFLGELYMTFCEITDSGLAALSSAKQLKLQILSFSGCRGLSDKSTASLMKMGESLFGLNLQHCSSMSSRGIKLLEENLWKCDMLY